MKHFLDLADWSSKEIVGLLNLAVHLKQEWQSGGNRPVLAGKALAMVFEKPSLRTRVSFDVAMHQLGGHSIRIGPDEIQMGKRESIPDIARTLAGYVQGITARVFNHHQLEQLAAYSNVPVVNALSDAGHPCQALADVLTILEHFGQTRGLNLAYVGDGNNVAMSLAVACAHTGINFSIATPPDYALPVKTLNHAHEIARCVGSSIIVHTDPVEAVAKANIIYTDTWVSMGQERESANRIDIFPPYQVNQHLIEKASDSVVVMHCLPAHRGQEITDDVADGPHSLIFPQAENRLHAQKAILVKLMATNALK